MATGGQSVASILADIICGVRESPTPQRRDPKNANTT